MILVSGSVAHDYIMTYQGNFANHILADKLPQLSMGFPIHAMEKYHGGTAHNIAYALGLLGAKDQTIMLTTVGKDFVAPHPDVINYDFCKHISDHNTATSFIFTDTDNNQITPFYAGALQFASEQTIGNFKQKSSLTYAIISPNDTTAMIAHLEEAKSLGITTIFDPGQCIHFLSNDQLKYAGTIADILILNEYERELWKQKTGLDEINEELSAHTIIVTKGGEGVMFLTRRNDGQPTTDNGQLNNRQLIDAIPCSSVLDPTGAGDALRGGLLYGLLNGKSLEASIQIGQEMAWKCIQSVGGMNYTLDEQKE